MHPLPYASEPYDTYVTPASQEAMRAALDNVRAQSGKTYPMVIGGKKVKRWSGLIGQRFGEDK